MVNDDVYRQAELFTHLLRNGYRNIRMLPGGKYWAATTDFVYTSAIIVGFQRDVSGNYEDRWCYHNYEAAQADLEAWDGNYAPYRPKPSRSPSTTSSEPSGWHRHPLSGRRLDEDGEMRVRR